MANALSDSPILFTGFPGFLSTHLLTELVQHTEAKFHFLCLRSTLSDARTRLRELERDHPSLADRWELHPGDITATHLGLDATSYDRLTDEVGVVWHLAALYDLAVPKEVAYDVNVGGTVNILDFCEACTEFERLNYVSTCYVAGTRTGRIYEGELDTGQHHHNHYEATKFWAEVEVQRRRPQIPTAIFRPGIVIGNSQTGATTKYDGPYFVFQLLHRLPEWLPVPHVGSDDTTVNLVPIDFVAQALAELGHDPDTTGGVFHLADPHPMTARQIVDRVLEAMGHRRTMGSLPARWVERALSNDAVEAWAGLPRQALTYFHHRAHFDTAETDKALQSSGLQCPPLAAYLDRIVGFFLRHPDGPPDTPSSSSQATSQSYGHDGAAGDPPPGRS